MKTKVVMLAAIAAGTMFAQYRDEYGQPGPYNGDPRYGDSRYEGPAYDDGYANDQYYTAPPPPPMPAYAVGYRRPPMPGPGWIWVDGYWGWGRGRYLWVNGYWARPPYGGAVWVAPRYNSGRFFVGFWSGGRRGGAVGFGYRGGHRDNHGRGYRR